MKIAGRDAGRIGVVLSVKDGKALIDGQVRRREVSVQHIEPVGQSVDVSESASSEAVQKALEAIGVEFHVPFANKRPRVGGPKPVKQRAGDKKPAKTAEKKPAKKEKPAAKKDSNEASK